MAIRRTRTEDATRDEGNHALSAWLKQDLARRYAPALHEPVTDELLLVIDRFMPEP